MRSGALNPMISGAACVALIGGSAACSSEGSDSGLALPYTTDVYVSAPVPADGTTAPEAPVGLLALDMLDLSGHLEGQLRDIPLSGATTSNFAELQSWDGGGYLHINAALGTPYGAGMLMLSINGATNHPMFTEGSWSSEREMTAAALEGTTLGVYVGSCAGPEIGNYPYEQQAVEYDMAVEADPQDPSNVVVVVAASFYTDDGWTETSELVGTLRFRIPEQTEADGAAANEAPLPL